jgi:hypothetical protein
MFVQSIDKESYAPSAWVYTLVPNLPMATKMAAVAAIRREQEQLGNTSIGVSLIGDECAVWFGSDAGFAKVGHIDTEKEMGDE